MYPIFPGKLTRTDITSFQVFRKLCGDRHFLRIIGVTTKWDSCPESLGEGREEEIWREFWKDINHRNQAITVHRLRNTTRSAFFFLSSVVKRCESITADPQPLSIQREIVVERKTFMETAAAKFLTSVLIKKANEPRRNLNPFSWMFRQVSPLLHVSPC